ncbi:MAG: hypothetical protein R3F61_27070 [Myxococcota bacterium]
MGAWVCADRWSPADATRVECPVDGVSWQLELRSTGAALFLEGRVDGTFLTTRMDGTRLREGAWALEARSEDDTGPASDTAVVPGLVLACTVDGERLHCAGTDDERTWEMRFDRVR